MTTPTRRRPITPLPDRHGVFTLAEARASGWTESALRCARSRGEMVRLRPGAYALAESAQDWGADGSQRIVRAAVAAALSIGNAVASHACALALAGLPLWFAGPRACVTLPPRSQSHAPGVHVHRATCSASHRSPGTEPARTTIARSIVDTAREHRFRDALVAADAALHRRLATLGEIEDVIAACAGWPGIRTARRLVAAVDSRSESPLESVSRLVLRRLELPDPTPQVGIGDEAGRFLGRADFFWERWGIVGEADGRAKYVDADALWREKRREDALREAGLVVIRWGKRELDRPRELERIVRRAVQRAEQRRPGERLWTILDPKPAPDPAA